ncbi:hypothetical protein JCM10213v2_003673 [Rhodosporidiobolus nylandii]
MPTYDGGCYCGAVRYTIELQSPDEEARSSMCHCKNCSKFTGCTYGLTIMIPKLSLTYTAGTSAKGENDGALKTHTADNGSGSQLTRWFCQVCGTGIAEVGETVKYKQRYVFAGTLDDKEADIARPKGEFFTKYRASWLQPVEGAFQKKEIKE